MAKETLKIEILYKSEDYTYFFEMPADLTHAQEAYDIGAALGEYKGGASFLSIANKETKEVLFVNLEEVRTIHMKTVVAD